MARTRSAGDIPGNNITSTYADDRQVHTIGIPGADSPTAVRAGYNLWRGLADSTIMCFPVLEVCTETYGYGMSMIFVWVIVWWHPVEHYRGMLRPAQWHTTLARAAVRATDPVGTTARLRGIEGTLILVLQQSLGAKPYPLQVIRAPWRQSWNFGLAGDASQLCTILRILADRLLGQIEGLAMQEHRELHISWH